MTIEELHESGYIVFETIVGSHAYGMATEKSYVDKKGVFVLPTEEVLAGRYIKQIEDKTNDTVFFEIGRFLELLQKGNPNVLDMLDMPEDCILYKDENWDKWFPSPLPYLTKQLSNTFSGYAFSQIKKARGLNKKIHWEEAKMVRKDVLDFCYVINFKFHMGLWDSIFNASKKQYESSIKFKQWQKIYWPSGNLHMLCENLGLAKVNNVPDLYSMYAFENNYGIVGIDVTDVVDSDDVRTANVPKKAPFIAYLRFDRNAYSTHCKDWREYQEWLDKRSEDRYRENMKGTGEKFDRKNMSHCIRLLNMASDIAEKGKLVVRRPEAEYLLSIRTGHVDYDTILSEAEGKVDEINNLFAAADLPDKIDPKMCQDLLLKIRLQWL